MSQEIKHTIGILCKVINLIYQINLKPEHFRLAKFNKNEENVIEILWNALFKISNENNISKLKNKLNNLDYKRSNFFNITYEHCGSRELLLALSFLISIDLKTSIQRELDKSVFSETYEGYKDSVSQDKEISQPLKLNDKDLANYKKWICGKTCLNNSRISEYNSQINKIYEKFNKSADIKASGSLTLYEMLALKNNTYAQKFLTDSESVINLLNFYTEWLKKEKVYWKWMIISAFILIYCVLYFRYLF